MVEIEVRKSEAGSEKVSSTNLGVNEIIGRVRDFVGSVRELSAGGGQPMSVSVEGFNFSVSKEVDEYTLSVELNLVFKPKESSSIAAEQV